MTTQRLKVSEDFRNQMVSEFKVSGMSQKEFCALKGICPSTLKNWLYISKRRNESKQFIPITIKHGIPSQEEIKILLKNGINLVVPNGFNEENLLKLIHILR